MGALPEPNDLFVKAHPDHLQRMGLAESAHLEDPQDFTGFHIERMHYFARQWMD